MKLLNELIKHNVATVRLSYNAAQKRAKRQKVSNAKEAYELMLNYWNEDELEHHESFKVILLNPNLQVLGIYNVAEGGMCSVAIDIKLILQAALLSNSHSVIAIHNHPTGNLKPSAEDIGITRDIAIALDIVNVKFKDHLIITKEGYFSFSDSRQHDLEVCYLANK